MRPALKATIVVALLAFTSAFAPAAHAGVRFGVCSFEFPFTVGSSGLTSESGGGAEFTSNGQTGTITCVTDDGVKTGTIGVESNFTAGSTCVVGAIQGTMTAIVHKADGSDAPRTISGPYTLNYAAGNGKLTAALSDLQLSGFCEAQPPRPTDCTLTALTEGIAHGQAVWQ